MIAGDIVSLHDRNQFEIKLNYKLGADSKTSSYNINLYMFIPQNLGVNRHNYTKNQFYEDLHSYVRLTTPKIGLKKLSDRLSDLVDHLNTAEGEISDRGHVEYEIKMIMCVYRSFVKDYVTSVLKGEISVEGAEKFLDNVKSFRRLGSELNKVRDILEDSGINDLIESFCEYSSMVTELYMHQLRRYYEDEDPEQDIIRTITGLIAKETSFKEKNEMLNVSKDSLGNEKLTYRFSVFKKFFYSLLFLRQDRRKDAKQVQQLAYAVAAGISMIFATVVVFITQQKYGNFTMSFFIALVISYMFKDRIKELFRQYFDHKLMFRIFDYKNDITDQVSKTLYGRFRERVRFINKDELDPDVVACRLMDTNSSLSTWYLGENILKYERYIKLNDKALKKSFTGDKIDGVTDIIRFDVSDFTKKMDDPKVSLFRGNGSNDIVTGQKVYHINMVVEFKTDTEHTMQKVRLVMTKKGIKRTEIPGEE